MGLDKPGRFGLDFGHLLLIAAAEAALLIALAVFSIVIRNGGRECPRLLLLAQALHWRSHSYDEEPNRVAGRIALPAPTPPSKRVRTRRFRLD